MRHKCVVHTTRASCSCVRRPSTGTASIARTSTSWTSPPTSTASTTMRTGVSTRRSRTRSTRTESCRPASRESGHAACRSRTAPEWRALLASAAVADHAIRTAELADIPAVLAVWAGGRSAYAGVADSAEGVAKLLAFDPTALLVATIDETPVATLIATWDGWRGQMYRLVVDPEQRRRGIARDLVAEGHRRLIERGVTRITALVANDDDRARGFWFSVGYAHDRRRWPRAP